MNSDAVSQNRLDRAATIATTEETTLARELPEAVRDDVQRILDRAARRLLAERTLPLRSTVSTRPRPSAMDLR